MPAGPRPTEDVDLSAADGRVLAVDVAAGALLPGFDNSAMDGYAVRLADVAGASEFAPVVLPVAGDIPAGSGRPPSLPAGAALRIMTGAPLPEGAEAIVQVEWTDGGVSSVQVNRAPAAGQHIRRAGEDVTPGQVVLAAGTRLAARHVSLLAAVGVARVPVVRRPRVVVVSTGSELVPPGQPLAYGQVHDSNGYGLAAAARAAGADALYLGNVADAVDGVLAALARAAEGADLVLTSGGVSAGAYDVVKEALTARGGVAFGSVGMQPGSPQGCGVLAAPGGDVPVLTFPGNPVSALVSFEVFARPVIARLGGSAGARPLVRAAAAGPWRSPAGKRQFVRARLELGAGGSMQVRPVSGQGSHLVAALAGADCLAVVDEDVTQVEAGDVLDCLLLDT